MKPIALALLSTASFLAACQSAPEARDPAVIMTEAEALGITNARAPFPGVLTAGQLTETQLDALVEAGYGTFVNLRGPGETGTGWEAARAAELGATYVSIPISGAADVHDANARRLAEALATAEGPAVVYCKSSNRVGALFALEAHVVDGKEPEESLAIGYSAGLTRLEPRVRELLGLGTPQQ